MFVKRDRVVERITTDLKSQRDALKTSAIAKRAEIKKQLAEIESLEEEAASLDKAISRLELAA